MSRCTSSSLPSQHSTTLPEVTAFCSQAPSLGFPSALVSRSRTAAYFWFRDSCDFLSTVVPVSRDREAEWGVGEEFVLAVQPFSPLLLVLLVTMTAPSVLRTGIFLKLIQRAGRKGASALVLSPPEFLCCMTEQEQRARGLLGRGGVGTTGWDIAFCALVSVRVVLSMFPASYYSSNCSYIEF